MATLVDTSVWIDLFRDRSTPEVQRLSALAGNEELLLGDLILAEVLQGIRDEQELRQVENAFATLPVMPLVGERLARQSAHNYRILRQRGITVRKTIDCLIATWCIENRVSLLHADSDFEPFRELGLHVG